MSMIDEFKSSETEKVDIICKFGENGLLTSHLNIVKLWNIRQNGSSLSFEYVRTFAGHKRPIKILRTLSNGRFASCDRGFYREFGYGYTEKDTIRIWKASTGVCDQVLAKDGFTHISDMVELPGNLLAVSGDRSIGIEGAYNLFHVFNVWNLIDGRLVVKDEHKDKVLHFWHLQSRCSNSYRLYCVKGFLIIPSLPNQGEKSIIHVWEVTLGNCAKVAEVDHGEMPVSHCLVVNDILIIPLATCNSSSVHALVHYRISDAGQLQEIKRLDVTDKNITPINDTIMSINDDFLGFIAKRIFNVDTYGINTSELHLCNYLNGDYIQVNDYLPPMREDSALVAYGNTLVKPGHNSIETYNLDSLQEYYAIRKTARLLFEARKARSGYIRELPEEMFRILKNAVVKSQWLSREFAQRIFDENFCNPLVMHATEPDNQPDPSALNNPRI